MKRIDVDGARRLMARGATVVDVLPEPTYRKVHLPGAINRPLASMSETAVADLDRTEQLVVYCFDQRCDLSGRASARLDHMGFTAVHDLIGGRAAWTVLGLPTEGDEGSRRSAGAHVTAAGWVPVGGTIADLRALGDPSGPVAVLDESDVLLGALDPAAAALPPSTPVAQAMIPAPGTIRPDMPLDDAVRQLERDGLLSSFVTTARGELVGVLFTDVHV